MLGNSQKAFCTCLSCCCSQCYILKVFTIVNAVIIAFNVDDNTLVFFRAGVNNQVIIYGLVSQTVFRLSQD